MATARHGIVDSADLAASGMTRGARRRRLEGARLFAVHRGVYSVGHEAMGFRARLVAALRAAGPESVLSHSAAGAVYRVCPEPRIIDVTVRKGRRRGRPGVRVHHAPLAPADIARRDGLALTSPTRTLLDLAAMLPSDLLERACAEAVVLGLTSPAKLAAAAEAAGGRRGVVALRRITGAGVEPTRSEVERAMRRALRAAGLPRPQVNARLGRYRPDFMWRRERLIVETDGWLTHGHRTAFERDRIRDADLTAAGWVVLRFTRRRIVEEPLLVTARIAQVLALRSTSMPA